MSTTPMLSTASWPPAVTAMVPATDLAAGTISAQGSFRWSWRAIEAGGEAAPVRIWRRSTAATRRPASDGPRQQPGIISSTPAAATAPADALSTLTPDDRANHKMTQRSVAAVGSTV
jgi:hypothetical protein